MSDLNFLSLTEMARGLRTKQFSALELLNAHLSQVEQLNPCLNAVVTLDAESARRQAQSADEALARGEDCGPLHGIPAALKDVWCTAGMRSTSSFARLKDYIPDHDATVVARVKAAGAIIFGKTNMPELAMGTQSNSPIFGTSSNPYDLTRTPGGSTGGGAAALASGMSAFEIGSDLGGSIRIPAHYCGVYGIKPTQFRVPGTGHIPPMPNVKNVGGFLNGMVSFGPLARSVEDLELLLGLLAGPDGNQLEVPPVALTKTEPKAWSQIRIAFSQALDIPVDAETRQAILAFVQKLNQSGCMVEETQPTGFTLDECMRVYGELLGGALGASGMGLPLPAVLMRFASFFEHNSSMSQGYLHGMSASLKEFSAATLIQGRMKHQVEGFVNQYDAWILPVCSTSAFKHIPFRDMNASRLASIDVDGKPVNYFPAVSGYVVPFNVTGHPSMVIPVGRTSAGLPIGVQLVGRLWSEPALLALAAKISRELTDGFVPPTIGN
jgi:amidase